MTTTTSLPPISPLASMEEAWQERGRLGAEGDRLRAEANRLGAEANRLRAEGDLVVIVTAQALYGKDVQIDWETRAVKPLTKENA